MECPKENLPGTPAFTSTKISPVDCLMILAGQQYAPDSWLRRVSVVLIGRMPWLD
jgi:hypothetical protein